MMKFAWDNYKQYALGKNELRPLTRNGHIGNMFGEWGSAAALPLPWALEIPCAGQGGVCPSSDPVPLIL